MNRPRWVLTDSRIGLLFDDSRLFLPTAREIFDAEHSRANKISGVAVPPPSQDLPNVSFSRFPPPVVLLVQRSPSKEFIVELGVQAGDSFVTLPNDLDALIVDGRWYPIDRAAWESATAWLTTRGIPTAGVATVGNLIALRTAIDQTFKVIDRVPMDVDGERLAGEIEVPETPELLGTLYDYQKVGLGYLNMIARQGIGCILADEMGLGKTLQVIALLSIEKNRSTRPSVVISPGTLLENWRRELQTFAPSLRVLKHSGRERAGLIELLSRFDVVLVSYDLLIRDIELFLGVQWNVVALDEAQAIKNPEAQRTLAVKRVPRSVSLAISGTPLENHLEDLWSIADFCLPQVLGSLETFRQSFVDTVESASRLRMAVAPIVLRRRIADVAKDLPELIDIPQALTMPRSLALAYDKLRQDALDSTNPLGAMTTLRQFCAHPALVGTWTGDFAEGMPKFARFRELADEVFENRQKMLVFASYQAAIDLLVSDVQREWPKSFVAALDGRTPVALRQDVVDKFTKHDGPGVLVMNPKAAGTGLNITAATHVVHYTPEWNPAVTAQASRRAYRRGQTLPVTVHHLFFANTVEDAMLKKAELKRALAEEAVVSSDDPPNSEAIVAALRLSPVDASEDQQ